jgi:hypothetical protein
VSELEKLFEKERRRGWLLFQPSPGDGSLFIENEPRTEKILNNTRMRFLGSFVWSQKINWTKKVELHLIRVNFDIERDADGDAIIGSLETYEDTCTVTIGVQAEAYDRAWNAILEAQALNSMQMTVYVRGELENWSGSGLVVENILFRFNVK